MSFSQPPGLLRSTSANSAYRTANKQACLLIEGNFKLLPFLLGSNTIRPSDNSMLMAEFIESPKSNLFRNS
jgi:hypothetical protein